MKRLTCLFCVVLFVAMVSSVYAEVICSFDGEFDVLNQELRVGLSPSSGGSLDIMVHADRASRFDFAIQAHRFHALVFEITEIFEGHFEFISGTEQQDPIIRGVLSPMKEQTTSLGLVKPPSGNFEIQSDHFFLTSLNWQGLSGSGRLSITAPYDIDLSLHFDSVPLFDFISWLGADLSLYAQGEVSGKVDIVGFFDQLSIIGDLQSYHGFIHQFYFDYIEARFKGTYPLLELTQTRVAEQDGMSFRVEGILDLSEDFSLFHEQLSRLKIIPLIRDSDISREWTIRRQKNGQRQSETGFQYRLKQTRESSGVEELDWLGVQHKIKF